MPQCPLKSSKPGFYGIPWMDRSPTLWFKVLMQTLIHERVALARKGENPFVIAKLKSGWVVAADVQLLDGYCILLSDPVVADINSLDEAGRVPYSLDTIRVGDALLKATDAYRINYETLGNTDPALHTHIIPRYRHESEEKRKVQVSRVYTKKDGRPFDPKVDLKFVEKMRELLAPFSVY